MAFPFRYNLLEILLININTAIKYTKSAGENHIQNPTKRGGEGFKAKEKERQHLELKRRRRGEHGRYFSCALCIYWTLCFHCHRTLLLSLCACLSSLYMACDGEVEKQCFKANYIYFDPCILTPISM